MLSRIISKYNRFTNAIVCSKSRQK